MPEADRQKWNARYGEPTAAVGQPSPLLTARAHCLPARGRALDLAGGAGRHALWLAGLGLETTLVDISSAALAIARREALERGLQLTTLELDLEEAPPPAGPWDVILSCCYLHRPLLATSAALLSPGGVLLVLQPTKKNLERHSRPPAAYLLAEGELPNLVRPLAILEYVEGWLEDGRHDALVVARKSAGLERSGT